MAFLGLDDEAFDPTENYAPVSSAMATKLRANVAAIQEARHYRAGLMTAFSGSASTVLTAKYCSPPWPVPLMPLLIYVPEIHRTVRVRMRVPGVTRTGDAGGVTDVVYLCLTTLAPNGAVQAPPPSTAGWTGLDTTSTAQTVTLTTRSVAAPGWIGAVVWVWSMPRETAIETGTISYFDGPSIIDLGTMATATGVPYASLFYVPLGGAKGYSPTTDDGAFFGVAYADTTNNEVQVVPPHGITGTPTTAPRWSLHAMGTVEISGMSAEVETAKPDLPLADAFASGRRVSAETYQGLTSGLVRMARNRVATLACGHALGTKRGTNQPLGVLVGEELDLDELDSSAWVNLQSTLVLADPPDDGGYHGLFYGMAVRLYVAGQNSVSLKLRLIAADPSTGAADATGATATYDLPTVDPGPTTAGHADWDGRVSIAQGMKRNNDLYQYTGTLMGHPDDWTHGLRDMGWFTCQVNPDEIAYPTRLILQAQLSSDQKIILYGTAGIASRLRNITGIA